MGNSHFTLADPIQTPQQTNHYQETPKLASPQSQSHKHISQQKIVSPCEGYCKNIERYALKEIDYGLMTQAQILEERQYLKQEAVFLSKQLSQLLSLKRNILEQGAMGRSSSRKPKHEAKQWRYAVAEQKVKNNGQLLNLLKKEYQSLESKLRKYQEPFQKSIIDEQIGRVKKSQAQLRANLSERKKKNILNEKMLTFKDQYKSSANKLYFDLQEDLLATSKKKEDLVEKIKEIERKNGSKTQGMQSIEGIYTNLQTQTNGQQSLLSKEKKNEENLETYQILCRRIELATKKKCRQFEYYKKHYESLVEEKQSIAKRVEALERKIESMVYFKPNLASIRQSELIKNQNSFNGSTQKVIQRKLKHENNGQEEFTFVPTSLHESQRQILRVTQKKHRAYRYKSETSTDMASNRHSSEYLINIPQKQKEMRDKHCQSTREQGYRLSNLILKKQKKFSNISCYQL